MRLGIAVALTLITIALFAAVGYITWTYSRDISSLAYRAYTASTASESLDYLTQLKSVLTERGLDKGYTAFIFNTPKTDLSAKMRNLDSAIMRMTALTTQEETGIHDMAYQVGMQEMIEELGGANGIGGQYSASILSYKKTFILGFLGTLFGIGAFIAWIVYSIDPY